jgi:hypothetical protein
VDGTIWIGTGYVDGAQTDTTFNGAVLTNMALKKLTIKGGWTGTGSTISGLYSVVNHKLWFTNWTGDITLSQISVNTDAPNMGTGLIVATKGNIVANKVAASSTNSGSGADFVNNTGTGNVTITGPSAFSSNPLTGGLTILSNGNISLATVRCSTTALRQEKRLLLPTVPSEATPPAMDCAFSPWAM